MTATELQERLADRAAAWPEGNTNWYVVSDLDEMEGEDAAWQFG